MKAVCKCCKCAIKRQARKKKTKVVKRKREKALVISRLHDNPRKIDVSNVSKEVQTDQPVHEQSSINPRMVEESTLPDSEVVSSTPILSEKRQSSRITGKITDTIVDEFLDEVKSNEDLDDNSVYNQVVNRVVKKIQTREQKNKKLANNAFYKKNKAKLIKAMRSKKDEIVDKYKDAIGHTSLD